MIKCKGGTQFKETSTVILMDDTGDYVEVIAELQDCLCRDGHVTQRVVEMPKRDFRIPDPLSEEARKILTGGRDEMIRDATAPRKKK